MEVNYKNKKTYNTAHYPIRQPLIISWLITLVSRFALIGKKYRIEKINMEGLKPPYMLLSNHMYFIDFEITAQATFPHRVNNVVTIDGYYRRPWLMELIGAICTRKFTTDLHLVKSINKVLKRGDILCMYPEARYSPCGTTSYMPESLGKLIRMNKVPVVCVVHHGNHLHTPFWNYRKKRKVPLYTTITQVLTAEQVKTMSVDEINEAVRKALTYDEYKYQKENGILITEPYRAEGLHKVLYQCPHCMTESRMASRERRSSAKNAASVGTLMRTVPCLPWKGRRSFPMFPISLNGSVSRYVSRCRRGLIPSRTRWRFILCPGAGNLRSWAKVS